jgi:hypothetical protein
MWWMDKLFGLSTGIRAVLDLVPIFSPGLSPSHFTATHLAGFAWQALFIAFERVLGCHCFG